MFKFCGRVHHVGSLPSGGGGFNIVFYIISFDGNSDATSDTPCVGMRNNIFLLIFTGCCDKIALQLGGDDFVCITFVNIF